MWDHDDYLDSLPADEQVRAQVGAAEGLLHDALPGITLGQILIGNGGTPPPDGPPFGGLWYFSERYRIVVASFLTQPNFDISYAGPLQGCRITFTDWNPGRPTGLSHMNVIFRESNSPHIQNGITARGPNCTQLYHVAKQYLLPSVRSVRG